LAGKKRIYKNNAKPSQTLPNGHGIGLSGQTYAKRVLMQSLRFEKKYYLFIVLF